MEPRARTRVLCVDDEANVLEGLNLHLRRRYDVVNASDGPSGLKAIESDRSIAVILSDMRMPGMTGAEFLKNARSLLPDAVRMLLTGQTDLESARSAINEG